MDKKDTNKLHILFVSRTYPPVFGGIENQNYGIAQSLSKITPTTILANKGGKKALPWFLPYALIKMLFLAPRHDVIVIGDGVLAPLAWIVHLFFSHIKIVSIVHGLDVTYAHKKSPMGTLYRFVNIPALKHFDQLIMVGNHTIAEAVKIGIARDICTFIPNGIDPEEHYEPHTRDELAQLLGVDLTGKKVILRVGRFVPHKGVAWFLEHVFPFLPEKYLFVAMGGAVSAQTAGDSSVLEDAQRIVAQKNLTDRVFLLTNLPEEEKIILFNTVDLVVSPNIDIAGSMEGFGINAIETAVCERVVVASDFQGLQDAVHDGKNGFLVPHEDKNAWKNIIERVLRDDFERTAFGAQARRYTIEHFSWTRIAHHYYDTLKMLS